jgi:hypothetical protein
MMMMIDSADMLAGVRQLQHLRSLSLSWCTSRNPPAAADYAALTASTHLTSLTLINW